MFNIELDLTKEELLEAVEKENKQYIEDNYSNIIQCELEFLENYINEGSVEAINTVNDNRGELNISNDEGEEIGSVGYWATITV